MKKTELTFAVILVPLDFLLVFLAALSAHSLRFGPFAAIRPVLLTIPWPNYLLFSAGVSALFVLFFALAGLYAISGPRRLRIEISRIFLAGSTAILTVIAFIFFRHELFESRFIILAAWMFAVLYTGLGRIAIRLLQRKLLERGIGRRRVALIGNGAAQWLADQFERTPGLGYAVTGRFQTFDADTVAALEKLKTADELDEIMVANPDVGRPLLENLLAFAQSRHIGFKYVADPLATHAKNVEIGTVADLPMVEIKGTRLDGWGRVFKRIFDILCSLLLIVLTSPVMLVAAIAVVLDSGFPILFRRLDDGTPVTRVGEGGRPFAYFKFRSMRPGTHGQRYKELAERDTRADGPLVKIKDDPRVTRVGRFIRRFSIDELPELFLVLAGRMSLVGPRPHLPEEVAQYQDRQRRVLTIKPGITGLAQVSGRADLTFEDEVKLDMFYIENWSPWLDLIVLAKTPLAVLGKKGAY
ncbi:hypothetical protein A3C96_02245 [Candidatus Uhrbacteria bacterium RIFCSPHIGHO2_02_FULL_60_10]|uniref:Bacterial sugar transferase domain-containing protein n=1 Tax=Candidatus Uhrbacteria bacterium RIFCSPHIGHO2_02_FULL_60_10 TaxID=1802392 RepID=A0A1F7U8J5_9BACT|nr:MAG: hypothetical protein A3C96_02245 [Candidatus Uhrbacteria bacterium RIFCSPHIGHO2_02_FULL_60_10]